MSENPDNKIILTDAEGTETQPTADPAICANCRGFGKVPQNVIEGESNPQSWIPCPECAHKFPVFDMRWDPKSGEKMIDYEVVALASRDVREYAAAGARIDLPEEVDLFLQRQLETYGDRMSVAQAEHYRMLVASALFNMTMSHIAQMQHKQQMEQQQMQQFMAQSQNRAMFNQFQNEAMRRKKGRH